LKIEKFATVQALKVFENF